MAEFKDLQSFIYKAWDDDVLPVLGDYIRIPNVSPYFDADCLTNGHQDKAMDLLKSWVQKQGLKNSKMQVVQEKGRTPLMIIEVEATRTEEEVGTVLMYGHMDKQPPFEGWDEGLAPYEPVIKNGKLFGRGGADDGYSTFCAVLALKALQKYKIPHSRVVILIEGSEESGSPDLPFYVEKYKQLIKSPNLIICLDSGCGNYEQLWVTSSLRGIIGGELSCKILKEGVHSGDAGGIVADTFRLVRQLLSRVEDEASGEILLPELKTEISDQRMQQLKAAVQVMGKQGISGRFPFVKGAVPMTEDPEQMALNRWWRPQLAITGQQGLPNCAVAGNVLRPMTKVTVSMRLPPTVDAKKAQEALTRELTRDPPYNCEVVFKSEKAAEGWAAPEVAEWLQTAVQNASNTVFNKPAVFQGEGGSIPFMGMLGRKFPKAQFCVVGLLGPGSNAHGPNESLDINFAKGLNVCISLVLADHFNAKVGN